MPSDENILQITPFMHVRLSDFERTIAFFRDLLGFKVWIHAADYAYVQRGPAGMRIWGRRNDDPEAPPHGIRNFRYYIDVKDVEAIYQELKPKLDALPPGDVHGPADKAYGQRELLIRTPDGDLLCFGQEIKRSGPLTRD
jgi:catechol 2,3-dioxygenase-like lactoylglutathione lyase family enzyme